MKCKRCRRKLSNVKSLMLGYGSTCYKKKFGETYSLIKHYFPKYKKEDVISLDNFWNECEEIKNEFKRKK